MAGQVLQVVSELSTVSGFHLFDLVLGGNRPVQRRFGYVASIGFFIVVHDGYRLVASVYGLLELGNGAVIQAFIGVLEVAGAAQIVLSLFLLRV